MEENSLGTRKYASICTDKHKTVNQPRQQQLSAGTHTDDIALDKEGEIEKERKEQEYQAIMAESLDLGNEDCTGDRNSEDEDSGLDSGFWG